MTPQFKMSLSMGSNAQKHEFAGFMIEDVGGGEALMMPVTFFSSGNVTVDVDLQPGFLFTSTCGWFDLFLWVGGDFIHYGFWIFLTIWFYDVFLLLVDHGF